MNLLPRLSTHNQDFMLSWMAYSNFRALNDHAKLTYHQASVAGGRFDTVILGRDGCCLRSATMRLSGGTGVPKRYFLSLRV